MIAALIGPGWLKTVWGIGGQAVGIAGTDGASGDYLGPTLGLVLGFTYFFGLVALLLGHWQQLPLSEGQGRTRLWLRRGIAWPAIALIGFGLVMLWLAFLLSFFDPSFGKHDPVPVTTAGIYSIGALVAWFWLWSTATGKVTENAREKSQREALGDPPPMARRGRWAWLAWPGLAGLALLSLRIWWNALLGS